MIFVRKENENWFWRLVSSASEISHTSAIDEAKTKLSKALANLAKNPLDIEAMTHYNNMKFLVGTAEAGTTPAFSKLYKQELKSGPILINEAGGFHNAGKQEFVETIEAKDWRELRELKN